MLRKGQDPNWITGNAAAIVLADDDPETNPQDIP